MEERLFAIGDIHGCFDPFREMVEDKIKIRKSDRIILLGDYIDRGYQSKEVVDFILNLRGKGFDIISLIGNHESMLLDALENEKYLSNWILNGGAETLFSFKVDSIKKLSIRYVNFFTSLLYYYSQDQFLFVHAGFNNEISEPFEDRDPMIWLRREEYSSPVFREKIIVHGHTPIPFQRCRDLVKSGKKVINIDTGCVYDEVGGYGHLTAVELNTMELFSV
jgi:serine/threonine protein phosphatase 1